MKKALIFTVSFAVIMAFVVFVVFTLKHTGDGNAHNDRREISLTVSIPPLKYLVDRITGNEIPVNVILPPGSGPETYEPTPRKLKELEDSPVIFITGLIDFENTVARRVGKSKTVSVSDGIELIAEEHHHDHSHDHGHHHHGADPHIWSSPARLKTMALNIYENIPAPLLKDSYSGNFKALLEEIDELDRYIRNRLSRSNVKAFMIYHPALTYYADDYGVEQLQLEYDGKEPSADKLKMTLQRAQAEGLDKVLYQKEFTVKTVETVAKDLGAVPVEIDPLDEDVLANIRTITDIIAGEK